MSRRGFNDTVLHQYKNEKFNIRLSGGSEDYTDDKTYINFTYKNVSVQDSFEKPKVYYSIADDICKMIDDLGTEKATIFFHKRDEVEEIKISKPENFNTRYTELHKWFENNIPQKYYKKIFRDEH